MMNKFTYDIQRINILNFQIDCPYHLISLSFVYRNIFDHTTLIEPN